MLDRGSLEKLTVPKLKEELKARGVAVQGREKKGQLIDRLLEAQQAHGEPKVCMPLMHAVKR